VFGANDVGLKRSIHEHYPRRRPTPRAVRASFEVSVRADQVLRSHNYRNHFSDKKQDKLLLAYLSEAAASAVCSLLTFWVDHDLSLSVDEISSHCQRIVEAILHWNA
jgi:hypothetical protein